MDAKQRVSLKVVRRAAAGAALIGVVAGAIAVWMVDGRTLDLRIILAPGVVVEMRLER